MSIEDSLSSESNVTVVNQSETTVDPDIWPGNKSLDFMLPSLDWKKRHAQLKEKKSLS